MITASLGRVSPSHKGEYNSSNIYTKLDIVSYLGSSYMVLKDTKGVTPVVGANYQLIAGTGTTITSLTATTGASGSTATVTPGGTALQRTYTLTIPRGDKGLDGKDGSFTQKAYTTEALMIAKKAEIPTNTSVMVTNDTASSKNGLYAYNGTTFTKSAYDPVKLANLYTDSLPVYTPDLSLSFDAQKNVYSTSNNIANIYINVNGFTVKPFTGAILHRVPVKEAEVYLLKPVILKELSFSAVDTVTVGTQLTAAVVESVGTDMLKVTVPTGMKFLFFNVKVSAYDYSASIIINKKEPRITGFANIPIADTLARELVGQAIRPESLNKVNIDNKNIGDTVDVMGRFIAIGSKLGKVGSYPSASLREFPLIGGQEYSLYIEDYRSDLTYLGYSDTTGAGVIGNVLPQIELLPTSNSKVWQFTAPVGANFGYITTYLSTFAFDVRKTLWINKGAVSTRNNPPSINTINGTVLRDSIAHERIDDMIYQPSKLKDKSWIVIGDSITEKNFRATLNYYDYIDTDVGGMTKIIKGYSGKGFVSKVNLPDELTTVKPDYITIALGTNDSGGGVPLGDFLSTDTGTLSGCINTFITKLLNKYPLSKIAFFTPLPRKTSYGSNATKNSMGYALIDVAILIKKYADHYSLPCLDLYHASNLHPWIPAANEHFFSVASVPLGDGVHPNDAGQRVMADKIRPFLESI